MLELCLLCAMSTYHIGNSLTNDGLGNNSGNVQTGTFGLEAMAQYYGYDYTLAMHIDSSQGLTSIWEHPEGNGVGGIDVLREPYGGYTNAFAQYAWNSITLEPYLKPDETLGTDKLAIEGFVGLARQNPANQSAAFYVYQVWPRQSFGDYSEYWLSESVNDDSTAIRPKRQYYDNLMAWGRARFLPEGVLLREIPAGEVWHRIDMMIDSGEIAGITMADLYRDDLHGSGAIGRYLAAATNFATLFKQDIRGMPKPSQQFGDLYPQALYDQFNAVIWDVVTSDPDTGVADWNDDGYVDQLDLGIWQSEYVAGTMTGRDFLTWQRNYLARPALLTAQVPEPPLAALVWCLAWSLLHRGVK